tara:strand:+ start:156 stop:554 length:399 start_codon:yes stop_codon:yes gene_type:complete
VAPKVKDILKAEEAVVEKDSTDPATGAEAAAHLEQLLQDLFAGTEKKSVYMGKTYDHLYLWYTCVHVRVCIHISHLTCAIASLDQATSTTRAIQTMRGSRRAPTTSTAAASSAACCFSMSERRESRAWGRSG